MAFDETLAKRVRALLIGRSGYSERRMFGGIAFMLDGRMCCGVLNDELVARVDAADYAAALTRPQVRPMDFTGRPMKGYLYIAPAATADDGSLTMWVERCVSFVTALPAKPPKPKKKTPIRRKTGK